MKNIVLLSFCILMFTELFSGCSKKTEKSDESSTALAVSNDTSAETHSQNDVLSSSIEIDICEHKMPFPCEFKEFGDEFRLENEFYFEEQNYTLYHLYYQHEDIGTIYLAGKPKDDNSSTMVTGFDVRDLKNKQFSINGLGYDTMETYIEHFGEPDVQKENYLEYTSENIVLSIFFDENNNFCENVVLLFTNYSKE
ncbi:MAG: hypothetical protein IJ644_00595 [Oscillospiraceae bacterium]|nr:hypothetical protein [Oscillospiraceae bacterium]